MKIEIKTNNDAFIQSFGEEVARILREIAKDIETKGTTKETYNDINGNKVCFISY